MTCHEAGRPYSEGVPLSIRLRAYRIIGTLPERSNIYPSRARPDGFNGRANRALFEARSAQVRSTIHPKKSGGGNGLTRGTLSLHSPFRFSTRAEVAELADALGSGPSGAYPPVQVQVLSSASSRWRTGSSSTESERSRRQREPAPALRPLARLADRVVEEFVSPGATVHLEAIEAARPTR